MCLVRLGQLDKARLELFFFVHLRNFTLFNNLLFRTAFERALEVDEECVSALVSLAVLDENEHTPDCLKQSIFRLGLAYKLESDNPVVLVNLANHLFYKRDLQRVDAFATHALNIADSDTIKSEACYQLARCYHVQGDFERAFKVVFDFLIEKDLFLVLLSGHDSQSELNSSLLRSGTTSDSTRGICTGSIFYLICKNKLLGS